MSDSTREARTHHTRLSPLLDQNRRMRKPALLIAALGALLLIALICRPLSRLFFQIVWGALIALMAKPIAALYEKRFPRPLSCLMALLTLATAASGIIALFVPALIRQLRTAAELAPTILQWLQGAWAQIQSRILPRLPGENIIDVNQLINRAAEWVSGQLPAVLRSVAGTVDKLSTAFIAPVLSYYFLRDRELFSYQLSLLIPLRHRKRMLQAMEDMKRENGAYLRGQLLIALIVGALTALGLFLIGVPAWLVLGVLMGICEVIPYIGPIIGGIPIMLFALSKSPMTLVWALALTLGVQQLEGMVIAPRMMAGATGLHPVYVLLLLTAGSMLFGIWGLLFSIPAFICLRSVARVFFRGRQEGL
ncbi:MAG: AI-2E family transporter [Clostridiales bacterium]|nr:AI-2E family transporter [Clostridiales bacterium]